MIVQLQKVAKNSLVALTLFVGAIIVSAQYGCTSEYYAKQLVEPSAWVGKSQMAFMDSNDSLMASGKISIYRRITVDDDVEMDVWLLDPKDPDAHTHEVSTMPSKPRGTVLVLHGWTDSKARYLKLGDLLALRGYKVALVDFRAHGRSGGKYISWGPIECSDLRKVVDVLIKSKDVDEPIYVLGISMGALVAVQYAASDDRCKMAMAIEPPKDIKSVGRQMFPLLPDAQLEEAIVKAGEIAGFNPADASAISAAAKLNKPLMLIHGSADTLVPVWHSKEILAAAAGPSKMIEIPMADHASTIWGREKWVARQFDEFVRNGLKEKHQYELLMTPSFE